MKKSLIALAVLAAAGAASAQSSVTLFGIVDAAVTMGRGTTSDRVALTNSGHSSSQIGFRGTEDLGGGMAASFWLEGSLGNDDGTAGGAINATNQANTVLGGTGLNFNRRSTVSLSGGWGELRLGRHFNPTFWNLAVYDPFGFNGVGVTQAGAGSVGLYGASGVRVSNKIEYFLPSNMGGFFGHAAYWMGEQQDPGATEGDGDGYGIRVGYAAGPLNVAVAMSQTENAAGVGDSETQNIGGSWDFGIARLLGHYTRDEAGGVDGDGWMLGALVPVGAGEIRASYSQYELDTAAEPRTRKIALGYVHNLSKRTALYTTYARVRNNGGAATALGGSVTGANTSSSGLDIGVKHTF